MIGIVDSDRKATQSWRIPLLLGCILGVGLTVVWQLVLQQPRYNDLDKSLTAVSSTQLGDNADDSKCGSNSHEAEAAGCHFDIMASWWYSTECYHGDILAQMLQEVSFD